MLGIEPKISCCEIRITGSEMRGLIDGLRVGLDEENSLREEDEQKK
jgi:hypothetical protein